MLTFADVTLSALNAPESDVDIEGDSSSSKKLEFDSGKRFLYTYMYNILNTCNNTENQHENMHR